MCGVAGGAGAHFAFRALGAADAVAAGFSPPLALDAALGFGAGVATAVALVLPAAGAPPSAAMLLRSASIMLTTLFGRDGCSATCAGRPACLVRMRSTTASS